MDLYQIHRPDPTVDVEETLSALTDLIRSGKVRAIGTSTFPASEIVEAQWVAERRGLERFRTEQPPYSIVNRIIEREVLPVCQRYGMGVLVWSPLAQGLLTGRIRKGQDNVTHRSAAMPVYFDHEGKLNVVEKLVPLAEEAGLRMTHLALGFAIAHPGVTSAIIGPRTMEHLDDLLAGVDVTLDDDIIDRIDALAPPGTEAGPNEVSYTPPAVADPTLRRRLSPSVRRPDRALTGAPRPRDRRGRTTAARLAPPRMRAASRLGGSPNRRRYSRLKPRAGRLGPASTKEPVTGRSTEVTRY